MPYKKKIIDGYYYRTVTYDYRLKKMPYASAGVMHRENEMDADCYLLVSYTTPVLALYRFFKSGMNYQFLVIGHVNYSMTTIKHVIAFLREYVPFVTYQQCKEIYKRHSITMAINLQTRELIEARKVFDFYQYGHNE